MDTITSTIFESWVGTNLAWWPIPTFHTKMECVWIESSYSQLLDPSNMSHHQYEQWLIEVEIGIQSIQPSPYPDFWLMGGDHFGSWPLLFAPRSSEFGPIQAIHSSLTLPMSCQWYNEELDKVVIGIWFLQWTPSHQLFLSHEWRQIWLGLYYTLFSHNDGVCLNWIKLFSAAWPFQCLIISMNNG